jgi:hypothetical protein
MSLYINGVKMGKPYINGVKYNAYINGKKIWNDTPPYEDNTFVFSVEDNGSFGIPAYGVSGSTSAYQAYNWTIDWGDGNVQNVSSTSGGGLINHTYTDGQGAHTIMIKPQSEPSQGWFNAFGTGVNSSIENSAKIKEIYTPVTGFMRTMASYAFYAMFYGCSGIESLPGNLLPAAALADYCYYAMFYNCTGLTSLPENFLPAAAMANYCYRYMFNNCSGLTSLPSGLLPAATLKSYCYASMFSNCTGLTSLPSGLLPAATLDTYCYGFMFQGCTGLTSLPSGLLPATTLANYCYQYMFNSCSGLTSLPSGLLPAATLANYCYQYMFQGCTGITSIPNSFLPAATLASNCYRYMFYTCIELINIGNMDSSWFSGKTAQTSMFGSCTKITTPITYSDIPSGWK